ncbi:hypothetical protein PHLCEN_2v10055 [Hermanssonia centrifuga]|uniref:SAP domain-containing protein n=1 Tax=Hermanssonia centrifuga TaxID=98765 RepID=A0A2R6NPQ2_9APHY|nr:hypothetical protein PHLCEN_2v10055 [Hermanssonia centrifuga]
MLRHALTPRIRHIVQRRTFVSTVLLTRNWENESVNSLKKEAKKRGLLQTGNKSTLITRLQENERKNQPDIPPTSVVQQQHVRHVSVSTATEVPGVPSSAEPVPIPPNYPKELLDVRLPDLYQPLPEYSVVIPFSPDFWDSKRVKAESAPKVDEPSSIPKVITVTAAATHPGGGPSHALYPDAASISKPKEIKLENQGLWRDIADDLSLPTSFTLPSTEFPEHLLEEGILETTQTSGKPDAKPFTRTLDSEEKKGVWTLLGLLAGSWFAAGYFQATPAYAEKAPESSAAEKAAEQL